MVDFPQSFYFDRAVGLFGVHLENQLEGVSHGKKRSAAQADMARRMILKRYLGVEDFASPGR